MKHFEIADTSNIEQTVEAVQRGVLTALQGMIKEMSKDAHFSAPGLTWEQIDFILEELKDKRPQIEKMFIDDEEH